MEIQCKRCKKLKTESAFRQIGNRRTKLCEDCRARALSAFHASNGKNRGKYTDMMRERSRAARILVLQKYGGKCACCGESEVRFLALDHVANDGAEHRREMGVIYGGTLIVSWALRNGCPDTLQVLCHNCNIGRARNGGVCPHKSEHVYVPQEPVILPTRKYFNRAKLTQDEVREIRRRADGGEALTEIAKDYPVNLQNVWHVAHRKTWKNVV